MIYIQSKIVIPLILGIYDTNKLWWYIDTTFGVHSDMKSHTGMIMTMEKVSARSNSTKNKLNTNSSIGVELVWIDGEISPIIWYEYFYKNKGIKLETTFVTRITRSP